MPCVFDARTCERYTGRKVGRVQPVALCLLLALGALPAASLACQLVCAQAASHAQHHGTHNHSTVAAHSTLPTPDGPAFSSQHPRCDHSAAVVAAVTPVGIKMPTPGAILVSGISSVPRSVTTAVTAVATHSPPGSRLVPLALRL